MLHLTSCEAAPNHVGRYREAIVIAAWDWRNGQQSVFPEVRRQTKHALERAVDNYMQLVYAKTPQ
jgi:hypothetical protein